MNLVFLTMYFANRSTINVGVIITIWSINPFMTAVADYYINNEKLYYHHMIGLVCMVLCSVAICLKDFVEPDTGVLVNSPS